MERAFIFDKFNTFYDWGLILTAKTITPPEPKTNYVELDGMSGSLDLTEALTGEVAYKDRTISATFWTDKGNRAERERLLNTIVAMLHGKKIKIIEPDDTARFFIGRVKITSKTNIIPYLEFSVEVTCEPWRYSLEESERIVILDNLDTTDIVINNHGVKTLCPEITVNGNIKLTINDMSTTLTEGVYKITNFKLKSGANVVNLYGRGSISFKYREGDL